MATIYVVTGGSFVFLATPSLDKAQDYCRKEGGRYDQASDHRFGLEYKCDGSNRKDHSYLSGRSNRWNRSGLMITEIEVTG